MIPWISAVQANSRGFFADNLPVDAASIDELAERCRQYSPVVTQGLKWKRNAFEVLKTIYDVEEERQWNWDTPSESLNNNL